MKRFAAAATGLVVGFCGCHLGSGVAASAFGFSRRPGVVRDCGAAEEEALRGLLQADRSNARDEVRLFGRVLFRGAAAPDAEVTAVAASRGADGGVTPTDEGLFGTRTTISGWFEAVVPWREPGLFFLVDSIEPRGTVSFAAPTAGERCVIVEFS